MLLNHANSLCEPYQDKLWHGWMRDERNRQQGRSTVSVVQLIGKDLHNEGGVAAR